MLRSAFILAVVAGLLITPAASAARFKPRPIHNVAEISPRPLARAAQAGGAKWLEGGLQYQYGTNCVILGGAYSEPMVASYVRFGGLDHLPRVGETYTASIVVGVTGNPCPFGYSYVYTELMLPRGTQLAPGQAIQCIGTNRNGAVEDVTNATWRDPASPSLTGRYCPAQPSNGTHGGIGFGFRPIAQGQVFELRVKVVSSVALTGASTNDKLSARIESTGVYSNPAAPSTWIYVLPAPQSVAPVSISYPNPPFVSSPPASAGGPASTKLRGLTYTGFRTGYAFFRIYDASGTSLLFDGENPAHCAPAVCRSQLAASNDLWISEQPFDFNPATAADRYMFTLAFRQSNGALVEGPKTTFRPWKPDADADGIPDAKDACRNQSSPESSNGCPLQSPPPDKDADGVPDASDRCPTLRPAFASLDGCGDTDGDGLRDDQDACPTEAAATPTGCPPLPGSRPGPGPLSGPDATAPTAKLRLPRTRRPRSIAGGLKFTLTCSEPAQATVMLTVTKSTSRRLRLGRNVILAQASAPCAPNRAAAIRLSASKTVKSKLLASKREWRGRLEVALTDAAGNRGRMAMALRFKR